MTDGETRGGNLTGPLRVSEIIGGDPESVEEFEIIAVAEGGEGLAGITGVGTAFSAIA